METLQNNKSNLYRVKFILLLVLQIPALLLILMIFIYFLTNRRQLKDVRHKALLLLLIVNFIELTFDMPMPIHFYALGYVSPATPAYCTWWTFFEYSLDVIIGLLTVVISIQRHILIFHDHILRIRVKRYLFYYFPLLICIIYPLVLYTVLILFYPCDGTQWDYTSSVCGFANCYVVYSKSLATFDWTAETGLPTVLIIIANVSLVIRVVKHKYRREQRINWRKHRRLTLQLLSLSVLFLIALLPSLVIGLGQQLFDPSFGVQIQQDYIIELGYLVWFFLPWVLLRQISGFTQWIRTKANYQRNAHTNTIRPAN